MIWRRVLVPETYTLRELHGVFQVAMGITPRILVLSFELDMSTRLPIEAVPIFTG